MPTSTASRKFGELWIVLAEGRQVFSFDDEAAAITAVNDANIQLLTTIEDARKKWRRVAAPKIEAANQSGPL